jgi:hypothetical protein
MEHDKQIYLQPTSIIDSDHPRIQEFARQTVGESSEPVDRAVKLYLAVRDGIRYDPYSSICPNTIVPALYSSGDALSVCPRPPSFARWAGPLAYLRGLVLRRCETTSPPDSFSIF